MALGDVAGLQRPNANIYISSTAACRPSYLKESEAD
jgi:hypothetical protein